MPFGSDEFRAKATENDKDFDAAAVETVRKQMEFYFCDPNLPRDAFLLEEVARAKRGWVRRCDRYCADRGILAHARHLGAVRW